MPRQTEFKLKIVFFTLILFVVPLPFFVLRLRQFSVVRFVGYNFGKYVLHVPEADNVSDTFAAQDIIVRSVYFDDRPRSGHRNATVFLVEIRKNILSRGILVACQVGDKIGTLTKVHPLRLNGWFGSIVDPRPSISHTMAVVDCFDVPVSNQRRSSASLHYKKVKSESAMVIPAASHQPFVLFPQLPRSNKTAASYRILSCIAVVYGKFNSQLENWLRYQRTIGVDHVHMIASDSFENNGGLKQEFIKKAISDGFLSVDVWSTYLRSGIEIVYHSQMLAYNDCLYRFRSRYEYVIFTDQDEYFVPLVPGKITLHYYIDNWCYKGSCMFERVEYYPDCGLRQEYAPDGNLTSLLISKKCTKGPDKKSLHRSSAIIEVGIHYVRELMTGYQKVRVPENMAYVAHLRQFRLPPDGVCF